MGIRAFDLRHYIIRPTLQHLQLWTKAAENLLLGTAAQESELGTYLHQLNGPALGIYQIEPATHDDIWQHYLDYRRPLAQRVLALGNAREEQLIANLNYATAIARLVYLRAPQALPAHNDLDGLAHYYKRYYNTPKGKATPQQFIENYQRWVTHE